MSSKETTYKLYEYRILTMPGRVGGVPADLSMAGHVVALNEFDAARRLQENGSARVAIRLFGNVYDA
jgi:hypothetical protein